MRARKFILIVLVALLLVCQTTSFAKGLESEEDSKNVVTTEASFDESESPDTAEEIDSSIDVAPTTSEIAEETGDSVDDVISDTSETDEVSETTKAADTVEPISVVPLSSQDEKELDIDKTATELDENYESTVTLSIPAGEKTNYYDVVFVLDKSASANSAVTNVISKYIETISKNNAYIKTGVVSFYNIAVIVKELGLNNIDPSALKVSGSGTNLAVGIQLGTWMLDEDADVSSSHKYLIVISDGDTHVFNSGNDLNGTPTVVLDKSGNDYLAGPAAYLRKYGSFNAPDDWNAYLERIAALVNSDGTSYQTPWAHSSNRYNSEVAKGIAGYIPEGELGNHACTVDTALYYAYVNYVMAQSKGYNTYSVGVDSDRYYGPSFMKFLNGGVELNLDNLISTVYYVPAGSYVTDIMGEGQDSEGNYYNFDFVDDLEYIDVILNDAALNKVTKDGYYAFGDEIMDESGNTYYPFTLEYNKEADSFIWHFNIDLTMYDKVKLVYKVKLVNPQKDAGEYKNLYTNVSATLTTPDSELDFPKPQVSYEVKIEPTPDEDSKPHEDPNNPDDTSDPDKPNKPQDSDDSKKPNKPNKPNNSEKSDKSSKAKASYKPSTNSRQYEELTQTGDNINLAYNIIAIVMIAFVIIAYGFHLRATSSK